MKSRSRSKSGSNSSHSGSPGPRSPQQQQQSGSGGGQIGSSSGRQQEAASGEGQQYGEGNYAATRKYNEGLKRHLESSDVEREARDAAPRDAAESEEMSEAERIGRSKARGDVESPGRDIDHDPEDVK
jgi:hypothetical protein